MVAHLHGGLGHAGNLVAVLLEMGQVAEDKDLGQTRRIEPGRPQGRSRGWSSGAPSILPSGEACTPAAQASPRLDPCASPAASTQPGPMSVT